MTWVFLTLFFGVAKGGRELLKKAAIRQSSVMEVLLCYTVLSFLLVIPTAGDAFALDFSYLPFIVIKSAVIFFAWLCAFEALAKMPVSLYGVLDLSRVLFSTLLGVFVLGETIGGGQAVGLVLVCLGLLLLRARKGPSAESEVSSKYVILAFVSCFLNAVSATSDKLLMPHMTSSQLQFWYMLFLSVFYLIYVLVKRIPVHVGRAVRNVPMIAMSVVFVLADKALFVANADPNSRLTVMTLIKQSSCLVTILGGKLFFGEKNVLYRTFCACIVIAGILFAVL
ncbi:MAG: EamA family transporter [Clostridia bacterium]|nr:EamA family transporter [Clostridia bacterium]